MGWMNRLMNLFRRDELNSTLDEELQFHVESRMRDNIRAGMEERDARADAMRRFGSRVLAKEQARDSNLVVFAEQALQDVRYALRSLSKSPGFAGLSIFVMALGIGANTSVFTVVNGALLRPLPFKEPDRLFLISHTVQKGPYASAWGMSDGSYLDFVKHDRLFESVATYDNSTQSLTGVGDPARIGTANVTVDFFRTLGVSPVAGRAFVSGDKGVALLGDRIWRMRFQADPGVLGKTIVLDGVSYTVIGVMPSGFAFPAESEVWTPLEVRLQPGNSCMRVMFGRLKPGITEQPAQAALESFVSALPEGAWKRSELAARVAPLKELLVSEVRKPLLIFAGAVGFVLLIACANVANLLLIRAASRRQEITVRAALGAGRWRLMRQLLTESCLIATAGGLAGLLLARLAVPGLLALAPTGKIPRADEIAIDGWALAFTFGVSLLTGVAFGVMPAFRATRRQLRDSLNEAGRTLTGRSEKLRSALVVAEIALALVLLTGAGLMIRSFLLMRSVDPGFRAANVLTMTVELPEASYPTVERIQAFHGRMLARLAQLPGALSVGAVNWMPMGPHLVRGDFKVEGGRRLPPRYAVSKPVVGADYFRTMGIRLLRGRTFSDTDHSEAPGVAIISESVARLLWPNEEALGRRISVENKPGPGDWLQIVGVVDDVRQQGVRQDPMPAIYQDFRQVKGKFFLSVMTFAVRTTTDPGALASGMSQILRDSDRNLPALSIQTMEEAVADSTAEPRFQTRLLAAFSFLALLLAAVGIYGVLACSVAERTHEIGIRMALGASRGDVVGMVLRSTLGLAALGVVLGIGGALLVTRVLEKLLFGVKPTDPLTFVSVAVLFIGVALFAGLLPARRAAQVYPLVALRYE